MKATAFLIPNWHPIILLIKYSKKGLVEITGWLVVCHKLLRKSIESPCPVLPPFQPHKHVFLNKTSTPLLRLLQAGSEWSPIEPEPIPSGVCLPLIWAASTKYFHYSSIKAEWQKILKRTAAAELTSIINFSGTPPSCVQKEAKLFVQIFPSLGLKWPGIFSEVSLGTALAFKE